MEPFSLVLGGVVAKEVVAAVAKEVVAGIKGTFRYWRGRTASPDAAAADENEGCMLALRLWGSLLFECHAHIERMRLMVRDEKEKVFFAPFDFLVSDALMQDFCRVVPSPAVLEHFRVILAAAKRVDFFQRKGPGVPEAYGKAIGFARDAVVDKDIIDRYNLLVDMGAEIARSTLSVPDVSDFAPGNLLPLKIDREKPLDGSAL